MALGAFKGLFGAGVGGPSGQGDVDDLVANFPSPVKHYDQVEDPQCPPRLRWRRPCPS